MFANQNHGNCYAITVIHEKCSKLYDVASNYYNGVTLRGCHDICDPASAIAVCLDIVAERSSVTTALENVIR